MASPLLWGLTGQPGSVTAQMEPFGWRTESLYFRLENGRKSEVERQGLLSSKFVDVLTERNGAFLLSTGDTVARYAPPIWRAPASVSAINAPVNAMVEDAGGRVWFLSTGHLIELNGDKWKIYPLPPCPIALTWR